MCHRIGDSYTATTAGKRGYRPSLTSQFQPSPTSKNGERELKSANMTQTRLLLQSPSQKDAQRIHINLFCKLSYHQNAITFAKMDF